MGNAWFLAIGCFVIFLPPLWGQQTTEKSERAEPYAPRRIQSELLPNAMWVHDSLLSGGLPHGEAAFEELARYGIRTIISVDGITPDVAAASKHGMRYVHLPHGYDGISRQRQLELAKAIRELPKPIYIHCHHGRHRSPAAAAATCVTLGWLPNDAGPAILKAAGTNLSFRGLFESVANARMIEPSQLEELRVDFLPIAELTPLVDSMVAMEAVVDRLKESQKGEWNLASANASDEADASAIPDALLLREYYIELHRSESEVGREPGFLQFLVEGRVLAEQLEQQLMTLGGRPRTSFDGLEQARTTMQKLHANCAQCHSQYRDNPKEFSAPGRD